MLEKLKYTQSIIKCWVDSWGIDNVYIAFSGGKDSTVLLHIVRSLYPNVPAVFNSTGLQFPEVVKFVKTFDNLIITRPQISFKRIVSEYGWPVISKEQAQFIYEYRNTRSEKLRNLRWNGRSNGGSKISEKWKFMVNAPFKISPICCDKLKKGPAKKFEKCTGRKPIIGVAGGESSLRKQIRSCNLYDSKRPVSRPLLHWTEKDIWNYIRYFGVTYCKEHYDKGWERTGCVPCLFGIQYDSYRFRLLKKTYPKLYNYCMNRLEINEVLDFMGVNY